MAIEQSRNWTSALIERAKALLTRPRETWPEIKRDMTPSGELFTRYAAPLAALAPVAGLITGRAFGWNPFGLNILGQLFTAAGGYAFSMINLLVMSFITSKLAPRFGGDGSPRDAFKLIVYSSTAAWIASAAAMIPGLGFLNLASFYSLYLYFTGIGPMMKVPEAEKRRFGAVTIVCAIGLNMVTMSIAGAPGMMFGGRHAAVPHHDWRDRQALGDIGREIREAMGRGDVKAVPPAALSALLPAKIGDFERTGIESATDDGPGGSHAEGTYEDGDKEFTLKVVDLAGFGAMARMGSAFRIDNAKQDKDGFERVSNKDGKFVAEKWDNGDEKGSFTTMAAKRFLIQAEGEADSFDELKQAVGSIDEAKLNSLGK